MQGFEIDVRSFRAQNVGRPAEHLIREAVQNAFDENPDHVRVKVEPAKGRGLVVTVSDDGPGFSDEKDIWTIFSSGKRDDPTKRGRLGRGLKELISVASEAEVLTAGKRIVFEWKSGTLKRTARRKETAGTTVTATVPSWTKSKIPAITEYLRKFIPPEGTAMSVNGVVNARPTADHDIKASLMTTVYDEGGVPKETFRTTTIRLFNSDNGRWIYEMGIPVEPIPDEDGFEWSIDIAQRTPLRPERDMLPRLYVHHLYAHVANALMDKLPVEEMTDLWMEEAVGHYSFDRKSQGKVYVERRFGANAARAIVNDPHERNTRASEDGVNVVRTEHVSASVRDIIRDILPSTADIYPVRCAEARHIPQDDWTEKEHRFVDFSKWVALRLHLSEPMITIIDAPSANCEADSAECGTRIRVNRSGVGKSFFENPSISEWAPLIVHELAHRTGNGHDAVFWREVERLSGEFAELMFDSPSEVRQLLAGEVVLC